jgi:hypothetical protein
VVGAPEGRQMLFDVASLPPLRGSLLDCGVGFQGLTPLAINCRRSAANAGSHTNAPRNHEK